MTKEQMPKKFVVSPLSAERSMHAKWANMSEDLIGKHWTNEVLFFLLFEHCARARAGASSIRRSRPDKFWQERGQ